MVQHQWHFKLTLVLLQISCHCRITSGQQKISIELALFLRKSHLLCTITRSERNKRELNFVIIDQEVTPLLGLKSSQGMGLVKIIVLGVDTPVNNVVAAPKVESAVPENVTNDPVLSPFADVFHGIGCLPEEYSIQFNKDVQPVVHPPRRVPVSKKEAMKKELDQMVADKIITPVTEPTDWVSSVLAVPKKDGSVLICLDPRNLNTAIKRSHYPLPTVEDVTSRLTNAKVFSVMYAKSGF